MSDPNIETIPAARNLMWNPRPVGLAYWDVYTASGLSTRALATDRSYSGNNSVFYDFKAGNTSSALVTMGDWDHASWPTVVPIGTTLRGKIHLSGPVPNNILYGRIVAHYTDATALYGSSVFIPAGSTEFQTIIFPSIVTTKAIRNVQLEIVNDVGLGAPAATFYLGGADLRANQIPDSFVHGSAGPRYSWEGTVNASRSNRSSFTIRPTLGSGGQIYPTVTVQVVNRQNQVIRDITDHFRDGSINYDLDAEQWKGTLNITLDAPGLVEVLGDEFIRVSMRIERADGTVETGSLGMFSVDAPTERWGSGGYDTWAYEGKDILSLLATWIPRNLSRPISITEGTILPAFGVDVGESYASAINRILVNWVGLSPSQFSFPGLAAIVQSGSGIAWQANTNALTILTELLEGAGWQKPWITPEGIITSSPGGLQPSDVTPSIVLATGENSRIRWPFEVDPETSQVGNRVRVISIRQIVTVIPGEVHQGEFIPNADDDDDDDKKGKGKKGKKKHKPKNNNDGGGGGGGTYGPDTVDPDITVTTYSAAVTIRANMDPAHPLSQPRLGRFIDLPDVEAPAASSQATVDTLADQALAEASMVPMRVRLTTEVMIRGLNEVYELNMMDAYGNPIESGQGRYWCRGWSFQLGPPWEMVHNLTRAVSFTSVPWDST